MKGKNIFLILQMMLCTGYCTSFQTLTYSETQHKGNIQIIHEGILVTRAQKVKYINYGGNRTVIKVGKPVLVAQAEQEEKWGYFQFPELAVSGDSILIASWQMNDDSHMAYGKSSARGMTPMMSRDGGKTWTPKDRMYKTYIRGYSVKKHNGDILLVNTPSSINIKSFLKFPNPVDKRNEKVYYREEHLPEELRGAYLSFYGASNSSKSIHATLNDPGLLRYAINDYMPVIWWGNIKEMENHSLVAGVYPCYYLDKDGQVSPCGTTFYQSYDGGENWDVIGKIPSLSWTEFDNLKGDGGFTEPAFEVLADSTFICVMRTGSTSPMYKSFSYDRGRHWTKPTPFTPNGEKPQLLLLKNGVLVLTSGYPGIQIRFSLDGTGRDWTEPIDMISFMNADGTYTKGVSCGYTSIQECGDDSFYLVYSDFTTENDEGEKRKSILFRKITVKKYSND